MTTSTFPSLRFKGSLRPSQSEVIKIAEERFSRGERSLYIVAPPGSGKTVLGLALWAQYFQGPALVLSPNSTIQAQWCAKTDLFEVDPKDTTVATMDSDLPKLVTSLTYQAVTLPQKKNVSLDSAAIEIWINKLISDGNAKDPTEAKFWIDDLKQQNLEYYEQRLSAYRKQARDEISTAKKSFEILHQSSLKTLTKLREHGIKIVILDECHHLVGHWGRVLADITTYLDNPIVLGLTATPPDEDDKDKADVELFKKLLGDIDYEVPVPAVVKDGFLAPYQDLVYFVRPSSEEIEFVSNMDAALKRLLSELCLERPDGTLNLPQWILSAFSTLTLGINEFNSWDEFEDRDKPFSRYARLFLKTRSIALPPGIPEIETNARFNPDISFIELAPVIDRYIRQYLRRTSQGKAIEYAEELITKLRTFGLQITERGSQPCISPVGRVMAYSRSKTEALIPILKAEREALGDKIRAIVVTDFEKSSSISAELKGLMDEEAGGAVAAFKTLLKSDVTDALDPVLVTGSSVLVDDDLAPRFIEASHEWLSKKKYNVELKQTPQNGFIMLSGVGADWCPRVYVMLVTELFQQGLTKCLVGTRGILGEGWDATKVNVLLDLTTVTTSMTVNQLRGRSIRLDSDDPNKLANNWDVVCLAPEFHKGLDDYVRFVEKHKHLFGVTEDGMVEKGVGHVHAGLTEIKPEGIEEVVTAFNAEMISRVSRRNEARALWKIGEPYHPVPIQALEIKSPSGLEPGFPPFAGMPGWSDTSLTAAVGRALIGALREANVIETKPALHLTVRTGGYLRVFLEDSTSEDSEIFTKALTEVFAPLDRPKYIIPREIDVISDTIISKLLPEVVAKYFRRKNRVLAMYHSVPSVLSKNKDVALIFQRHWNNFVSPGEVIYAYHGEGSKIVEQAVRSFKEPASFTHVKEIFR